MRKDDKENLTLYNEMWIKNKKATLFQRCPMRIIKIKLLHFRNYDQLSLDGIGSGINILYGKNAQGKTNLLEAIHICSNGKSFRVPMDSKTVQFDQKKAYLYVEYEKNGRHGTVEVLIEKDKKKSIKINGIPATHVKELMGNLYTVIFSPEDIKMAREAPGLRRAFLDGEISKIRPTYIDALKNYTKIVAQKNAALRKRIKNTKDIIEAYNEQLAGYIAVILKNRLSYVRKLNELVGSAYHQIAGKKEEIEIQYKSTIHVDKIKENLHKNLSKELEEGYCFAGPHRDDIELRVQGKDAKLYASQGQLRTVILAMKVACLKILEQSTDQTPILLLDDVFSELDDERKKNLMNVLSGVQVFITTAEGMGEFEKNNITFFEVKNGKVSKTSIES